jgi:hypothetical protein
MIPKKPVLGLDPRVCSGFRKRSCSNKKLKRDDDSKKSHPALEPGPAEPEDGASRACGAFWNGGTDGAIDVAVYPALGNGLLDRACGDAGLGRCLAWQVS